MATSQQERDERRRAQRVGFNLISPFHIGRIPEKAG
jgi:hypothetical protein